MWSPQEELWSPKEENISTFTVINSFFVLLSSAIGWCCWSSSSTSTRP